MSTFNQLDEVTEAILGDSETRWLLINTEGNHFVTSGRYKKSEMPRVFSGTHIVKKVRVTDSNIPSSMAWEYPSTFYSSLNSE